MDESVLDKLKILAESAKYDVSCASSGTSRGHKAGAIGSAAGWGICHSFAEDGRCISLLKIMLTNYCRYDCAYCINRRSNDIPRATLSVTELVNLTIEFYRRNYIEGLFLSSGVVRNPDYTMERLVRIVKDLRTIHRFNGYIHLKGIPGASPELIHEAGLYADRMSVNIEIPNEKSLQTLAPEKDFQSVFTPMRHIQQGVLESAEERKKYRSAPRFCPCGTKYPDDYRSYSGFRQRYPPVIFCPLSATDHEKGILFGICTRQCLRQPFTPIETTAAGTGKPTVSSRLVIAFLSVQSG